MRNRPQRDEAQSSDIKFTVTVFLTTVLGIGCCGLLAAGILIVNRQNRVPTHWKPPATPTAEPTPIVIPLSSAEAITAMNDAMNLMDEGEYAQAVPLWDQVILAFPENGQVYYQRALCNYNLLSEERSQPMYDSKLRLILADTDKAIALQPQNGDYYAFRHDVLDGFARLAGYRVDQQAITRIAHDNARAAIALGYSDAYLFTDRVYVGDLVSLEQCDEALPEIEQMIAAASLEDTSITGLYRMRAEALACLGRYEEAVDAMNSSLSNPNFAASKMYYKAVYLYQLGKPEEALAVLDESIASEPGLHGYRYYLRALIYYDQDRKGTALTDWQTGAAQTWERLGLYAYIAGKVALDEGLRERGIELLQQAEASLSSDHLLIRSRIVDELADLDAQPLVITPSTSIVSTPISIEGP